MVGRAARALSLPVLLCAAGCGGGGGAGAGPTLPARPLGSVQVLRTDAFDVSAGATGTLNGSTIIVASREVTIAGTLAVPIGALFGIVAPSIHISGAIVPTGSLQATATLPRFPNLIVSDDLRIDPPATILVPGGDLSVTSSTSGGTIAINGTVTGSFGFEGTSSAFPDAPGGARSGGAIDVGTQSAVTTALATLAAQGIASAVAVPGSIRIGGRLRGGTGGRGYSDANGTISAATVVLAAGPGGKGGNVIVGGTGSVDLSGATIAAGDGGGGGDVGTSATQTFSQPVDATLPRQSGLALTATMGCGGDGGSTLRPATLAAAHLPAVELAGRGGAPGSFSAARAGNGGPDGGDGGATTINDCYGGNMGGTTQQPQAYSYPEVGAISLAGGGSGARSATPGRPGGAGGAVFMVTQEQHTSAPFTVANYANGGDGYGTCPGAPPTGSAGGPGGSLWVTDGYLVTLLGAVMNGGDGGAGAVTGGSGGAAGRQISLGAKPDTAPGGAAGKPGPICSPGG